ncbi:MAG TPA: CheR family methyltransferase [Nocardioidaceae bacterium]
MDKQPDARFEALLRFLKEQRGFDFTGYKRATLGRRVNRRMESVGVADYEDYIDYLLLHPGEFSALFNTILINVTSFFRDKEAWDYLQQSLLPDLLGKRTGRIRVWCAGCASGEEAYTLAMVFAEVLGVEEFRSRVKIYATDVDEEALAAARQATYGARDVEGVPEDLREKYFDPQGPRYAFKKDLRRSVIFGRNDLVQDAPISHVDLISCRNTLMYFNAETQGQVLQRMHFGLREDGFLFLGKAEMLLSHMSLFRPVELNRRFFQKLPAPRRALVAPIPDRGSQSHSEQDGDLAALRQAALMSTTAAQIVLDNDRRLVLSNHRASHLFGIGPRDVGRPLQDLEVSYRPLELRTHLDQADDERRQIWVREVSWTRPTGDRLTFDVQFVPLTNEGGVRLGSTVIFSDVSHYRQLQGELEYSNRQLETAYEELQSTNEELETTNEELQSTVEELETTNEELQSSNEELETMNEELQSLNDELNVTNETLRERQEEVDHLNGFMVSVLGGLTAGIVVVDNELAILAWNAKAEDLWGVRTDEAIGEHLFNLDIGLALEQLKPLLKRQLGEENPRHDVVRMKAVNRRGRQVDVQVTVSRLDQDPLPAGAILVMDVIEPHTDLAEGEA